MTIVTFMRHGSYNQGTKNLSIDGITQISQNAELLMNAAGVRLYPCRADGKFNRADLARYLTLGNVIIPEKPQGVIPMPDVILTSEVIRAIQSACVLSSQLATLGPKPKIVAHIPCLTDTSVKEDICVDNASDIAHQPAIDETLKLVQEYQAKGFKHIVVLSHMPNIQAIKIRLWQDAIMNDMRHNQFKVGVADMTVCDAIDIAQENFTRLDLADYHPCARMLSALENGWDILGKPETTDKICSIKELEKICRSTGSLMSMFGTEKEQR